MKLRSSKQSPIDAMTKITIPNQNYLDIIDEDEDAENSARVSTIQNNH